MGRGQELLDAAREGDKRTVEKIIGQITKRSGPFTSLRRGAGVNVQDDSGFTPLHHACLRGYKDIVQLLLSVDASPCVVDKKGATPLHLAAWKGDADVVTMLLAHNNPAVNIDQLTSDKETALLIAARSGYVAVVELLLANGADVGIVNNKEESALDLAAHYGRLETVRHLLRFQPQLVEPYKYPMSRGRTFSSTPLHRASQNGHVHVVQALIAAGVDPNVRTQTGTPLHDAACFGKASVVRVLLEKGADLNALDRRGKTVHDLLADYSKEATSSVREAIRDYENLRNMYESEEDLPQFPVQDYSPTGYPHSAGMKAQETQKNTNKNNSPLSSSPSSSSITKNHPQSFVKKLASKCLGLKAKFNSAPNISNSAGLESAPDSKTKNPDHKSTNTLLIGNSKFFKILSKKEESGDVVCNDEFDTISLDRLGTLNRDSTVNRSNRSCPGFKTSLPNISENTELSDSHESLAESVVITEIDCDRNSNSIPRLTQAVNHNAKINIFEPREMNERISLTSNTSRDSAHLVNECYESYEFSKNMPKANGSSAIPKPPPRPTVLVSSKNNNNDAIYENVVVDKNVVRPTPAARTHLPSTVSNKQSENKVVYENVALIRENKPDPPKRTVPEKVTDIDADSSSSESRSSTLSSTDSLIDETNLEDILLSEKSKSFRHSKQTTLYPSLPQNVHRTYSSASGFSDVTELSAIENVDCSGDINDDKSIYLSMTGTLPNKKTEGTTKKKVLFRHKTFTNIEIDRNSFNTKDLPNWDSDFLKETLAGYHIRGTGHCIYTAPTVQEFIYIFNRDTLYRDVKPFTKVLNDKRDSYFETAICFCKPKPPKHHNSAEDLLELGTKEEVATVSIDLGSLKDRNEITSTTFRCFCDSGQCKLHDKRRKSSSNLIVKFSMIKRSISTPDITLAPSPTTTVHKSALPKIKSVPSLEDPYAVVSLEDIISRNKNIEASNTEDLKSPIYTTMSQPSTLSSTRPYSIKDIAEVISINSTNSTDASLICASGIPLRKSCSSEYSGHWSLQSCNSNVTIKSDASFKTCLEDSDDDTDGTLHSDGDTSDAETIKSEVSTGKRPWVHSDSFRFGSKEAKFETDVIAEESKESELKFESGISVGGSESSSSGCDDDSGVPRSDNVSLGAASLERVVGMVGAVRSGSGRRRWDEADGVSEGDALSVSSAASSCAPLHLAHHHDYSKVSPTPPKKPPRRNLSVSPTHANSPSSGYSYELRPHARSQDDLDDIPGAKHYLKHGRSVDQYVDGKLSYSEFEENHNSPRIAPVPNPRPSLKNRTQPVAITAMYENVVIKEQNPRRKYRRNNFNQSDTLEPRMENRVRKFSNQERSSLESLLDDQSMNSPSDCEKYDGQRVPVPLSPTHYDQPPTPDHPPPSAKQAEISIHERIRPLSQLIMEVVEEIRIRKKSQDNIAHS